MILHVYNVSDITEKRMYVVCRIYSANDVVFLYSVELLDMQTRKQSHLGQLEVSLLIIFIDN